MIFLVFIIQWAVIIQTHSILGVPTWCRQYVFFAIVMRSTPILLIPILIITKSILDSDSKLPLVRLQVLEVYQKANLKIVDY